MTQTIIQGRHLVSIGNSYGFIVPKYFLDNGHIKQGASYSLIVEKESKKKGDKRDTTNKPAGIQGNKTRATN